MWEGGERGWGWGVGAEETGVAGVPKQRLPQVFTPITSLCISTVACTAFNSTHAYIRNFAIVGTTIARYTLSLCHCYYC